MSHQQQWQQPQQNNTPHHSAKCPLEKEDGDFVQQDKNETMIGSLNLLSNNAVDDTAAASASTMDKVLCEKLNSMSLQERTQGIHELHGVADIETETPEMLERKLRGMEYHLGSIVAAATDATATETATKGGSTSSDDDASTHSTASNSSCDPSAAAAIYTKVLEMDKDYVERIKLLYLRADCYDTQKAASRLISFFAFKQRLFGEEKLAKDITLEDLEEKDMDAFREGRIQLLQERDRAGRAIMLLVTSNGGHRHGVETWCRLLYYVTMAALRDEETQMKGIVLIQYSVGQTFFKTGRPSQYTRSWWLVPMRIVATHICYDNPVMHGFVKLMSQSMESHHLCRFRSHFGTYLECTYSLMTFGIPQLAWPIKPENNGELDLQFHHSWLNTMKAIEAREKSIMERNNYTEHLQLQSNATASNSGITGTTTTTGASLVGGGGGDSNNTTTMIVVPGPFDLVLGRGRHSDDSIGYIRFRTLLEDRSEAYDNATSRSEKGQIANALLEDLKRVGCRFLRRNSEGLMEVCDESESRIKVSHAFRNMRKKKLRMKGAENKMAKGGGGGDGNNKRAQVESDIVGGDTKRTFSELGRLNQ